MIGHHATRRACAHTTTYKQLCVCVYVCGTQTSMHGLPTRQSGSPLKSQPLPSLASKCASWRSSNALGKIKPPQRRSHTIYFFNYLIIYLFWKKKSGTRHCRGCVTWPRVASTNSDWLERLREMRERERRGPDLACVCVCVCDWGKLSRSLLFVDGHLINTSKWIAYLLTF